MMKTHRILSMSCLVLLLYFLSSSANTIYAQFTFDCLFNLRNDNCGSGSGGGGGGGGGNSIVLRNNHSTVRLPYCSTEAEIIAAFQGWFDQLIDPSTSCSNVRIGEEENTTDGSDCEFINGPAVSTTVASGSNTFWYEIGGNVNPRNCSRIGEIRLPGTCGGSIDYSMEIAGDCGGDALTLIEATFTLIVTSMEDPSVPDAVTIEVCEGKTAIETAYSTWVNGFRDGLWLGQSGQGTSATLFCFANPASCDVATFYGGCGPSWNYTISNSNNPLPVIQICSGNPSDLLFSLGCLQEQLTTNRMFGDNEKNCGVTITVTSTNDYGDCGFRTSSSTFTVVAPTVTASGPANNSPESACQQMSDLNSSFKTWLDQFDYSTSQGSCSVNEEFYVNGSTDVLTRSEVFPTFCGGTTSIEYVAAVAGCRQNRSAIQTATFTVEEIEYSDATISVCSGEALGFTHGSNLALNTDRHKFVITDINPNGLMGDRNNIPNRTTDADGVSGDIWYNDSDQTVEVIYTITPRFECSPTSDGLCNGNPGTLTVKVQPAPKTLRSGSPTVQEGDALNLSLIYVEAVGTKAIPDLYDVEFVGFSNCVETFVDGLYTPINLNLLLTTVATTDCAVNCMNQTTEVRITPLFKTCRGQETVFDVTIAYVDAVAPTITCPSAQTISCLADLPSCAELPPNASDDCPGFSVRCQDGPLVGGECGGTILRTFTVTDVGGNTAQCTQLFTIDDSTPPVITCPTDQTLFLEVGCTADTMPSNTGLATATDDCVRPIVSYADTLQSNCGSAFTFERTWKAEDACGNQSACVQTIRVLDEVDPTIACPPDLVLYQDALCSITEDPIITGRPTVSDNCTSVDDLVVEYRDQKSTPCVGHIIVTRTWSVEDECGNPSSCEQSIEIRDTTPPQFTYCPADTVLYLDTNCFADSDVTNTGVPIAMDNCTQQNLNVRFEEVQTTGCTGERFYARTWTAEDDCGNTSICRQSIMVLDTSAPILVCPPDTNLGCNPTVPLASIEDFEATDNCSEVSKEVMQGEVLQTGCLFSRTDVYMATDECLNSRVCQRTLVWKVDQVRPVFSNVPRDVVIDCEDELPAWPDDLVAFDNCDGELSIKSEQVLQRAGCGGAKYRRTWTATDGCGNSTQVSQWIELSDTIAPVLSVPADTTISLGSIIPEPTFEVSDQCSQIGNRFEELREDNKTGEYTLTRSWVATDGCGNRSSATQVITVVDTTPPQIILLDPVLQAIPSGGIMQVFGCGEPALAMSAASVFDNNPMVDMIAYDKLIASSVCDVFGYARSWECGFIATDGAGNISEYSFFVHQYDTTAPVFDSIPADIELDCGTSALPASFAVAAYDDCGSEVEILSFDRSLINPYAQEQSAILRTWTAEDGCGNVAKAEQIISSCGFDIAQASAGITGRVWLDTDEDGIQDAAELGLDGVTVKLFWMDKPDSEELMFIDSVISQTTGGVPGTYGFDYIMPGYYRTEVVLADEHAVTQLNTGSNDSLDCDIDPLSAQSEVFWIDSATTWTFHDIGVIESNSLLSVDLATFDVASIGCVNRIYWSTANEVEVATFTVQRKRGQGAFQDIGSLSSAGGQAKGAYYEFYDEAAEENDQYRLRINNLDGSTQLSAIVISPLECPQTNYFSLEVFPNPTDGASQIRISLEGSDLIRFRIYDEIGRVVRYFQGQYQGSEFLGDIDLLDQPPGMYYISAQGSRSTQVKRLIKLR